MNVCCTLAFWFSLLSDSSDTNNRQAKEKPTGRPKPPAAKVLFFGSGSDRLSVICQKRCEEWSYGDKQATVCLVSVKVRHRIVWHKNKNRSMRISSHSTSLCFQLVSHPVCVSQGIILASCWMRRWRSFPSTSWRTRCTGAVLPTTWAWHSCKCACTCSLSA